MLLPFHLYFLDKSTLIIVRACAELSNVVYSFLNSAKNSSKKMWQMHFNEEHNKIKQRLLITCLTPVVFKGEKK